MSNSTAAPLTVFEARHQSRIRNTQQDHSHSAAPSSLPDVSQDVEVADTQTDERLAVWLTAADMAAITQLPVCDSVRQTNPGLCELVDLARHLCETADRASSWLLHIEAIS